VTAYASQTQFAKEYELFRLSRLVFALAMPLLEERLRAVSVVMCCVVCA
jgi:hypothetical protein